MIHVCCVSSDQCLFVDGGYKSRIRTNLRDTSTFFKAQFIRLVHKHMRADDNVFGISTTVRQTKHSITLLETTLALRSEFFDYTAEFHTEGLGCLGGNGVLAFALEEIHAVETEGFDADESLSGRGLGTFDLVDEEGGCGTLALLDICMLC